MNIVKKTLLVAIVLVVTGTQAWAGLSLDEKSEAKEYAAKKYLLLQKNFKPATQLKSVMDCYNDLSRLICIEIPNETTYKNLANLTYQDLPRKLLLTEGTYDSLEECKADIDNVLKVFPNMLNEIAKAEKREGKKIAKPEPEVKKEITKIKRLQYLSNENLYHTKVYTLEEIIKIQETKLYKRVFFDKSQKELQSSIIDLFDLAISLEGLAKEGLANQNLPNKSFKKHKKEIDRILSVSRKTLLEASSQITKSKDAEKKEIAKKEKEEKKKKKEIAKKETEKTEREEDMGQVLNVSQQILVEETSSQVTESKDAEKSEINDERTKEKWAEAIDRALDVTRQILVEASSQITKSKDTDKASLYAYKKLFEIQKTEQYKNVFFDSSQEEVQGYLTDLSDLACLYIPFGLAYKNLEKLTNQNLPYLLKLKQEAYDSLEECKADIDNVLSDFQQTLLDNLLSNIDELLDNLENSEQTSNT
ncbi:hypothetical protein KAT92_00115 [Candidatus Babeliales bacterium]|nr:hypothetical protein [Candidatus Babeliales bacterium]